MHPRFVFVDSYSSHTILLCSAKGTYHKLPDYTILYFTSLFSFLFDIILHVVTYLIHVKPCYSNNFLWAQKVEVVQ